MYIALTILHILVSLALIGIVLLQSGKAADLAGAFGGMGSQTAFGPRGAATLLSKATTAAAVLFMLTSLSLAILGSQRAGPGSVLTGTEAAQPAAPAQPVPAQPGQPRQTQPLGGEPQQQQPAEAPPPSGPTQ